MDWRDWFYLASMIFVLSLSVVPMMKARKIGITRKDFLKPSFWYVIVFTFAIPQLIVVFLILNLIVAPKDLISTLKRIYAQ